jgi:putative ABC transport system permease protein
VSLWRQITRGLRNRKAADRDIADEVSHYLDQATAEFAAKGLSPEEAARAARMEMGNATSAREQILDYGWENAVAAFAGDLRYAARRLRGNPGFSAVGVLTLALGIGASAAIFSVIDGVLLKPLPYPHAERLVALTHTAPGIRIKELNMAASLYLTYREEGRVFQDVTMWTGDSWTLTGVAEPEKVTGLTVTHRFLAVLGITAAIGRDFTAADEDPKGERTVMLSDGYWRARFGGELTVIGRRILLDGNAYQVIGVLPRSFSFMDRKISMLAPLRFRRADIRLISFCCQGIGRLKPGVTLAQANADVARMLPMAPAKFPMNPGFGKNTFTDARIAPRLQPLKDVLVGDTGNTLWMLMGTVGIVLLIACANVGNLFLVRAEGRRQELATRAALGAGFGRIAQELLLESALLSVTGGVCGLVLAAAAVRVLVASDLAHLPRSQELAIDPAVAILTLAVSLAVGVLFGLIPVIRYARPHFSTGLRGGGRGLTGSKERTRARSVLVVVQVALALVLLVGSGLMVRTFRALRHVDPGFSAAAELETIQIGIPRTQVPEAERVIRMEEAILRKLETIPGVSAVGAISSLPLDGGSNNPVAAEDQPTPEGGIAPIRRFKFVSPGYFAAAGSRLIAGRDMTWPELYSQTPVALVSENMARELWHDPRAAVGKRIRAGLNDDWREVIGVVADLRDDGIEQKPPAIVYWPLLGKNMLSQDLLVRSLAYVLRTPRAGSVALLRDMQQVVASVNPGLPVADVKTLDELYARSLARTSFALALLAIAGAMSLVLGVVGIYGMISYSVSQRSREMGIRIALGARSEDVTGLFVRHGLLVSAIGTLCGLSAAFALTRLMKSMLFEVSPADPATYVMASGALIVAAALASYLPARRAARVDPVEALRAE